ncbi:MAG TPA: DUF4434 domain-containing protein [Sedimentisphaerales bacterium]|nr:DUF4434 domain-containing protein [Sedimentisphaerales bacterium]HRS10128.1 DUF4434 domain-containing protein [Sedimentisphaerales bacterium]HRV46834.1 DUF4434 domain-containing protein [Sedimentisphaerales bacterium]
MRATLSNWVLAAALLWPLSSAFPDVRIATVGLAAVKSETIKFLYPVQIRPDAQPSPDGGGFRAFDFKRWEVGTGNADSGWGVRAVESGGTQDWIASVLGMRQMRTPLWDPVTEARIAMDCDRRGRAMSPDEAVRSLTGMQKPRPRISLTLIPPSPVTDRIELDVRGSVRNDVDAARTFEVVLYLDEEKPEQRLHQVALSIAPQSAAGFGFRWPTQGHAGRHHIIMTARSGDVTLQMERPIEIIRSDVRSTRRLGGAWVDLYHHDEQEGRPFNTELGKMTDENWRELVRAMHATEQNLLVITMMFQNFTHRTKHDFTPETYPGKAYYPSGLYPARMPIASADPLETIMDEADRLGMHVMPGVGTYAFFDYTPNSLRWCTNVADELWRRYGHHQSFYGWYLSHEQGGGLYMPGLGDPALQRREIVDFFKTFTSHVKRHAPDKPVLLATNPHGLRGAEETYRQLLPHVDILGPFGFHRMPEGDLTGEQAATLLQSLCDEAGCHLWLDVETFVFRNGVELHPRPIGDLIGDFQRFPDFEKILHYQFPGIMSAPAMTCQPGGPASVTLYEDYRRYLEEEQDPSKPGRSRSDSGSAHRVRESSPM